MSELLFPFIFRRDCRHEACFFEHTVRELAKIRLRKTQYLADSETDEHKSEFSHGSISDPFLFLLKVSNYLFIMTTKYLSRLFTKKINYLGVRLIKTESYGLGQIPEFLDFSVGI